MKISLDLLGDYIEFTETDPQKIADAVTAHTAEVDEVEVQGQLLEQCCVGKVLSVSKHPNADKLKLCEVLTDKGAKNVVCGGANLREGMRVAFAHIGARVKWHGEDMMTLEPVKIRGEQSEGMICAAEELGIESLFPECTGHDIVDMGDGDEDVGKPLKDVLGLRDVILHVDNHAITHRADLFSHVGFAFECVAMGIAKWKQMPDFKAPEFPTDPLPFKFRVTAKDAITRYCSCLLSIDSLGETPEFIKRRLNAVGIRSISLPIDITNYVMIEMGVPMHSFDADDIKGDFVARLAKQGEPLQTLDEQEWELPEGALVFTDDEGNFDLVGIMGGLRSSTKDSTRRIYLHALSLDPVRIRNAMIATGHRTDAGTIYEKGVPHIATELGFYRALDLFLQYVPGAKMISAPEVSGNNGEAKPIKVTLEYLRSMLGADVTAKEVERILTDLAFSVEGDGDALQVTPPLHRLGDISGKHDILEEVGRIYGYNTIEAAMPDASIEPPKRDTRTNELRDSLQASRYVELTPLSLVGPDLLSKTNIDPEKCTVIHNAIGKETSLMTPSTVPALLEHAQHNMLNVEEVLRTFFVSTVFSQNADGHKELGMLVAVRTEPQLLQDPFLIAKQDVETALQAAGYDMSIDICKHPPEYAHAGRSATVLVNGKEVGTVSDVHPDVRKKFDLPSRAAVVTLSLSQVLSQPAQTTVFTDLPQHPAISYDMTVDMSHDKSTGKLLNSLRSSSKLLESVSVVDLYGKDSGDYKLTIRCTYRSSEKTLTEQEVKQEFAKVEKLLS